MAQKDVLDYIRETPHNSNVNVVRGMLNGLDGGGSLPTVTASDNGMVLTVVEGAWDKAASSGGGEPLMVHETFDDPYKIFLDKTFGEIRTAWESGRCVYIVQGSEGYSQYNGVYSIAYSIEEGSHPRATGYVHHGSGYVFSANTEEGITSLEALDALYPYTAD